MSRFESSRFIKDPKVMNPEALKRACDALGWKYTTNGEDLLVTDLGGKEKLHGEFALKVSGGTVTYNSYYLKNGAELVEELKSVFFPLNVAYANVSPIGFGDDLLPFFLGFDSCTVGNPKLFYGKSLDERKCSAEMILVRVRDDEGVQVRNADMMQVGNDDVLP